MLENLFGSRTRTKLLRLFLTQPDQAFFIRELTRKIDTQINSVRRELKNLMDTGIIIELAQADLDRSLLAKAGQYDDVEDEDEGGAASDRQLKKYFRANLAFPLYEELRALFVKSPQLFQMRFATELPQLGQIDLALLTGFFVGDIDGPVDIFIVGDVDKVKLAKLIADFEQEIERELNYTVMAPEEFKYRKSVTDKFLFNVLEGKQLLIMNRLGV